MKNFITVGKTEDEQEQQIKKWLRDNIPQIIAGIVLGLGGIWGLDAYKAHEYQQSIDARMLYLNSNSAAFEQLNEDHVDSGYLQQAILMQAKIAAKDKKYELALQHLSPLINDENSLIANIATMRMASVQLEMGNFSDAIATLNNTSADEFNGLYSQLKGDIYVASNNINEAKKYYRLALSQISTDSELQSLISIKLADLN
ncbi:Mlr7403 protein [uncultured Candidatus Thioglobus sp.]|nr:Mlr7403 protein [uncultured Candidatus Thioglobus sp.]